MKRIYLLLLVLGTFVFAQETDSTATEEVPKNLEQLESLSISNAKKFEIGDLKVSGVQRFTKNQIIRFTGLFPGNKIKVPGPEINNAIKKLWRTNYFSDVEIFAERVVGDKIYLRVHIAELPELLEVEINGIRKGKKDKFIEENELTPGKRITQDLINQTKNSIVRFYSEKGYPEAKVEVVQQPNPNNKSQQNLIFNVDQGPRVKIKDIDFVGNTAIGDGKLRKKGLKKTKRKNLNIFSKSKFDETQYREDLKGVLELYRSIGYRDVKIVSDSVTRLNDERLGIKIFLDEGNPYYLGDVTFVGNSVYTSEQLQRIFGYAKGDVYDAVGIDKKISGSEKDDDISSVYLDAGYLFSRVFPIEKNVKNDTIDLEIRILEGEPARYNRVTFNGNTTTHDHVIARELRTKPGDLFSKRDIRRTILEFGQLGFFEPAEIVPDVQPNPANNTIDIDWKLAERSSSQIELQGGYGGGRFIGTLGLTFGNFSIGNLLKGKKWRPVPLGDGQQLSLRGQAATNFSNFSLTFVEPWIGGKKPTALSTSLSFSRFNSIDQLGEDSSLNVFTASVGLSKLLQWPDDFFRLSQTVSYQRYTFQNQPLRVGNTTLNDGRSDNINYNVTLSRLSQGVDPVFPTQGSEMSLSLTVTPPWSLFSGKDFTDPNLTPEDRFEVLEYYKILARAYWFKEFVGKFVIRAGGEFGFLGDYNSDVGVVPFERFYLGGTGLQGQRFDGREIIPLRGYEDFTNNGGAIGRDITPEGGGTVYNKFLLELRYPITLSPSAKIYGLTFFEAGNTWLDARDFQPFELKRSAGFGIRIFMAAFGLLGFDFGYGYDPAIGQVDNAGWQTHFIFGQNL